MQQNNDKEIIVVEENPLAGVDELTPQHFDYLQSILHKMNQYHYRHVKQVSWKTLTFWILSVVAIQFFNYYYIQGFSFSKSLRSFLLFTIVFSLITSAICIFSKCLTRLYHLKHIGLKLLQSYFIFTLVDIISPFFLVLNNVNMSFEVIDPVLEVFLVIAMIYFVFYSLVPYKWLKRATVSYVAIVLVIVSSLSIVDSFSHYVLKDNELVVYSNIEGGEGRDLSSIDKMVDEVVKK